ncbi:MAG: molybdenum cofactor guanylyltransferase [Alphaproteobacteria bacterium]|jgi:molybdopterin-guanine dinucleotide biosynthesis protein A|nr:molybdenum cofactor guanylyltransferase [Alphaproteobacteria bacterium]
MSTPRRKTGNTRQAITAVVLAGGAGRRMGGADKGLLEVAGRPLVLWVLAALAPQADEALISANRNLPRYQALGVPVVRDRRGGFQGPLAGIAAAFAATETDWLLVSPCDTPLLPSRLALRLWAGLAGDRGRPAMAADAERTHPLHALLPRALAGDLEAFLDSGGRSVCAWLERHHPAVVRFDEDPDAFANLNRPEDQAQLAARLAASPSVERSRDRR